MLKSLTVCAAMLASPAFAGGPVTITYPQDQCATILGSDYSAPAADSMWFLLELHCVDVAGNHAVLITSWTSGWSMFGFGRSDTPPKITLVPGSVSELVVE